MTTFHGQCGMGKPGMHRDPHAVAGFLLRINPIICKLKVWDALGETQHEWGRMMQLTPEVTARMDPLWQTLGL